MGFKVLNGTLAVIRGAPEKLSSGGIALTTDEHLPVGEVVGLGDYDLDSKGNKVEWDIVVGDRIVWGTFSGQTFEHEGKTVLVLKSEDVFAVLEDESEEAEEAE